MLVQSTECVQLVISSLCVCMCTHVACLCIHVYMYIHVGHACACVFVGGDCLVCVGVCAHVITFLCLPLCVCVCVCTCGCPCAHMYTRFCLRVWVCVCAWVVARLVCGVCVCVCVCGWVVAPLVCGVCVERQRSLVPILYRLLISECVVAKCFLFLFSSRESIPWFLSVPRGRTRPPHMSRYLCVYTISYS